MTSALYDNLASAGGDVRAQRHRITISGDLGEAGREAFGDFDIEPRGADTVLIGEVDQPRMRSVLNRVRGFGLKVVDLRIQDETPERLANQSRADTGRPTP